MIYIFSSFTGLPDQFFQGYAFDGANFISGKEGARQYFTDTGKKLSGGLDGCYVAISREGDLHRVGVDYGGLKKLFLYRDDKIWALSNSIVAIARHLAENGVHLRPNWVQMQSLTIETTITRQHSCFDTVFSGIEMIPSWCNLELSSHGIKKIEISREIRNDYTESLHDYIETWVRRFETLFADGRISLSCDLTGGKDSRMVLALVEKAKQRLGKSALSELSVKSSTASRWKRDIIVAKRIAAHFNQNLNQKLPPTQGQIKLSGKSVFAHWANLNLGIYYPVYFPLSEINPFNIHIHGGGGERHRSFYNFSSLEDFSKTMLRATTNKAGARDWISEVERVLETLQSKFPGINPWILHYREFRNRFHSGRNPQYRTVLAPLDGPGAEALSDFPNKSETSQIHFDVMESLFPGLKDFPYDDPKKGPSREALAALTVVPVNDQAAPGRAYVAPDIDEDSEPTVSGQPLDFLIDRFERADAAELRDFMPTIYGKALKSATQVKDVGKFSHASDGENIARVLSANQVLSRTERS